MCRSGKTILQYPSLRLEISWIFAQFLQCFYALRTQVDSVSFPCTIRISQPCVLFDITLEADRSSGWQLKPRHNALQGCDRLLAISTSLVSESEQVQKRISCNLFHSAGQARVLHLQRMWHGKLCVNYRYLEMVTFLTRSASLNTQHVDEIQSRSQLLQTMKHIQYTPIIHIRISHPSCIYIYIHDICSIN